MNWKVWACTLGLAAVAIVAAAPVSAQSAGDEGKKPVPASGAVQEKVVMEHAMPGMPGCMGGEMKGDMKCGMGGGMNGPAHLAMRRARMGGPGEMARVMKVVRFGGRTREHGMRMEGMRRLRTLDLSADQWNMIRKIRVDSQKALIPKRAQLRVSRIELREALRAPQPNMKEIEVKLDELGKLRRDITLTRIQNLLQMRQVLTPDQLQKFMNPNATRGCDMKNCKPGCEMMKGMMPCKSEKEGKEEKEAKEKEAK